MKTLMVLDWVARCALLASLAWLAVLTFGGVL